MDPGQVVDIISQVGFPIFVALLCMWYVKYNNDKHSESIDNLNKQHKEEIESMITAINNNTIALTKLEERLGNE